MYLKLTYWLDLTLFSFQIHCSLISPNFLFNEFLGTLGLKDAFNFIQSNPESITSLKALIKNDLKIYQFIWFIESIVAIMCDELGAINLKTLCTKMDKNQIRAPENDWFLDSSKTIVHSVFMNKSVYLVKDLITLLNTYGIQQNGVIKDILSNFVENDEQTNKLRLKGHPKIPEYDSIAVRRMKEFSQELEQTIQGQLKTNQSIDLYIGNRGYIKTSSILYHTRSNILFNSSMLDF